MLKYVGVDIVLDEPDVRARAPDSGADVPRYANHAPEATAADTNATEKFRKYIDDCSIMND